jgi:thiol:disulfide interchange protein DsbD
MMIRKSLFVFAAFVSLASAGVRSGKAEAEWIGAATTYEPGKPLQMAIRLVIDPGWHSYWSNPGDAGMRTSVKWELPAGWLAGELENPLPERFTGAGIAGFGYRGTVVFPVVFTPPAGFRGTANLKARVSWLTCDDRSCVPGNAELSFSLNEGDPATTPEAELIDQALARVPRVRPEWGSLEVDEMNGKLVLRIVRKNQSPEDLSGWDVFPVTPGVIHPGAPIGFKREGDAWITTVAKGDYAPAQVREFALVMAAKSGEPSVMLDWKIR